MSKDSNIKRIITAFMTTFMILLVVSGAIAIPLFVRSFYYAHIDGLEIPERTGYSEQEIRSAFDEMMDYCMGTSDEFGTGTLAWSDEGKSHFDDCKVLFKLDKVLLVVSLIGIVICTIISVSIGYKHLTDSAGQLGGVSQTGSDMPSNHDVSPDIQNVNVSYRPQGFIQSLFHRAGFIAGTIMLVCGAVLGAFGTANFDAFFVKFHQMFFPGKDNWIFDPAKDEIIKILPEEFFRNCAILIVSVIVIVSVILIINGVRKRDE